MTVAASATDEATLKADVMAFNGTDPSEDTPAGTGGSYGAVFLVPAFILVGLLGILVCHILKKKGYRCTSTPEPGTSHEDLKDAENGHTCVKGGFEGHEDTVGAIARLITENPANAEALKELQAEQCEPEMSLESPTSPDQTVLSLDDSHAMHKHSHTIHGVSSNSGCARCTKEWQEAAGKARSQSRNKGGARPLRPGEKTVLAVGRFRVMKIPERDRKQGMSDQRSSVMDNSTTEVEAKPLSPTRIKWKKSWSPGKDDTISDSKA
ncbi:RELT-like protein 1 [Lethenteron reissneri]|uniref:RELT-like protein 1 n=1 Tax=Lethenteron reissneri TaxID=7753 RepID=UPI002AB6A204|nr:RELT-like protein 1 [Lethenteron reissneri]XP_061419936.1 RELT-like protein 1 [Lethenteron reissneri]XP_061419937.1 RELT-like protein 1 [Lethenteron reissneri]XP_061419938.1 RELT-like protein 1 [Lethenteron reissneri]XP_061419939.1 RELT-like protein 1 [Lethenteron reissneri]XP_061419940.1 RELT-like protein 1 [Lethenteron reissneri]XP_061419941.1 RELT-like protein 1 [Lethenteron reissneri]